MAKHAILRKSQHLKAGKILNLQKKKKKKKETMLAHNSLSRKLTILRSEINKFFDNETGYNEKLFFCRKCNCHAANTLPCQLSHA